MGTLAEHVGVGIEDRSTWGEVPQDTLRALELLAARAQVVEDGFVTGPSSATDGAVALFDGATGKLIEAATELRASPARLHIGDGEAKFVLLGQAPATGAVPLLTLQAAAAIDAGDGGSILILAGAPAGGGTSGGTIQLADSAGTLRLELKITGAVWINGAEFASNGTLHLTSNLIVDSGGLYGIDSDNNMVLVDDTSWIWKVGAVTALTITPTELSGNGNLRLTNIAGRRATFQFGWNTTNTAVTRHLYGTGLSVTAVKRGYLMEKAGSIVAITMIIDINAIDSSTIVAQAWKNNAIFADVKATVATPVVANGQSATATFAVGLHTFAAGDDLSMVRFSSGTSRTTDDTSVMMEVEYDS